MKLKIPAVSLVQSEIYREGHLFDIRQKSRNAKKRKIKLSESSICKCVQLNIKCNDATILLLNRSNLRPMHPVVATTKNSLAHCRIGIEKKIMLFL